MAPSLCCIKSCFGAPVCVQVGFAALSRGVGLMMTALGLNLVKARGLVKCKGFRTDPLASVAFGF
jgi:hypothetical protein